MTLRRKFALVRLFVLALLGVLVCVSWVVADALKLHNLVFLPAVALIVWLAYTRIPMRLARRAFARLARQMAAEDFQGARETLNDLRDIYVGSRAAMEQLRLHEGTILSVEKRYAEAAALLASLDRTLLPPTFLPVLLNNLAWSTAHSGGGHRAVELARESMKASESAGTRGTGIDLRALQLGTLGTALTLAGEPEEGAPLLEQALARGGTKKHQSARAFYLGEALRALGRADEATAAYERALKESGDKEGAETDHAKRARDRLQERKTYRT
jgi:tetratricopeptide (TPR) repeat protein